MTLNQFRNLELEQQEYYLDLIVRQRRFLLDKAQNIMEVTFRYLNNDSGWARYGRPTNTKAGREYDYIFGIYTFLQKLERQLDEIYTDKLYQESDGAIDINIKN